MEDRLALEQRVWQRVRGNATDEETLESALARLIRLSREQAAGLKPGNKQLYRREVQTLGLLTALYRLRFGKEVPLSPVRPSNREACRRRAAEMLGLYLQLETHRELGGLFTDLTRQQRATCAALEG